MQTTDPNTQLQEWLQYAFEEPADRINECYYFDAASNEFFSIFITDYFLISGDCMVAEMPYSPDELAILKERINRLEKRDPEILGIPRLSSEERKEIMHEFLSFSGIDDLRLNEQLEQTSGRSILNWNGLLPAQLIPEWNSYKRGIIGEKVMIFCLEEGIDLSSAKLWTDKKITTMTIDLREKQENDLPASRKKPWWKFW